MVRSAASPSGILQDIGRVSTAQNIGSWGSALVHRDLTQETRQYIRPCLARAHVLPAGKHAGRSAGLGQGHPRGPRSVDGDIDRPFRLYAAYTHTGCPSSLGVSPTSACHAIPRFSAVGHAGRELVRFGGWRIAVGHTHVLYVLSDSAWCLVIPFEGAEYCVEGLFEDRTIWLSHEVRVETKQLAEKMVCAQW